MAGHDVLPGDDVVPDARVEMDRRTMLDASAADVWPWLVQLGKRRAGWYAPKAIEWAFPTKRRGLRYIEQQWQQLSPGDVIPDWGGHDATFTVVSISPPTSIVYRSTRPRRSGGDPIELSWALVLRDVGPDRCEFRLRLRINHIGGRFPRVATALGDQFDHATVAVLFAGLRERVSRTPGR